MSNEQIQFNRRFIQDAERQIAELQTELQNPRIRKVEQRKQAIENLRQQIAQALLLLYEAGC